MDYTYIKQAWSELCRKLCNGDPLTESEKEFLEQQGYNAGIVSKTNKISLCSVI